MKNIYDKLLRPVDLIPRSKLIGHSSIVPSSPGIYAWYFLKSPSNEIDLDSCWQWQDKYLLYIGISPVEPPKNGAAPSKNNLRKRIRSHMSGNASSSTLRMSVGCLISNELGIKLRRVGRTKRMYFGKDESMLSEWLEQNAFVTWIEITEPWILEQKIVPELYLPLNLRMNKEHPFYPTLSRYRKLAREEARQLPVLQR